MVQHELFTSTQEAILYGKDIISSTQLVELSKQRVMVRDTDKGKELQQQIDDLLLLLKAYRKGIIKER
jgi:fructose-1,6-bisphosphatase-3